MKMGEYELKESLSTDRAKIALPTYLSQVCPFGISTDSISITQGPVLKFGFVVDYWFGLAKVRSRTLHLISRKAL